MALVAAWSVGAGETYFPMDLSTIHVSLSVSEPLGPPCLSPYHCSLAS